MTGICQFLQDSSASQFAIKFATLYIPDVPSRSSKYFNSRLFAQSTLKFPKNYTTQKDLICRDTITIEMTYLLVLMQHVLLQPSRSFSVRTEHMHALISVMNILNILLRKYIQKAMSVFLIKFFLLLLDMTSSFSFVFCSKTMSRR